VSPFSPKVWKDYPDTSTPITAAALEDLETRVTGYTDSVAVTTTDPRLADQRTPLDGSVTDAKVASNAAIAYAKLALTGSLVNADVASGAAIAESKLSLASDAAAGTASRRTIGTGALQACAGNDSRLSDSRWGLRDYLANGANNYRETFPRYGGATTLAAFTSGVMNLGAMMFAAGDPVHGLWFFCGTTGLTMGTNNDGHAWAALYTSTKTLVAQSADAPSLTWSVNTWKRFVLGSPAPYTVPSSGIYWVGLMINIGTGGTPAMNTLRGQELSHSNFAAGADASGPTGMANLAATNGSNLGASAPGGPISFTNSSHLMYCAAD
jgi:hypothetical protein